MLDCEGIAMLVEGIPRFPCGNAGGMGFWGLRGPLLFFFLCFLVSAGGLVFLRGFRCCWCCTRRLLSPRRKLSFRWKTEHWNQHPKQKQQLCASGEEWITEVSSNQRTHQEKKICKYSAGILQSHLSHKTILIYEDKNLWLEWNIICTIFLACSSQSGVWCVMSNTGMEHCWPSANLAVQLAKSCCERFRRMSTENIKETAQRGHATPPQATLNSTLVQNVLNWNQLISPCLWRPAVQSEVQKDTLKAVLSEGQGPVVARLALRTARARPRVRTPLPCWSRAAETNFRLSNRKP